MVLGALDARRRSEGAFERYAEALLEWPMGEQARPPRPSAPACRLPPARALRRVTTPLELGLFDMLRLQGCEVSRLIGERNSQLGRVRGTDYQFAYATAFIQWAPRCEVSEPELSAQLQKAVVAHRADLPPLAFNAIWTAPELRALFEPDSLPSLAPRSWVGGAQAAARGLRRLASVAREPLEQSDQLSPALEQLYRGRASAQVWRLGARALAALQSATAALSTSAACPNGREAQRLFETHYVGAVQPQLVQVHGSLRLVSDALSELLVASTERLGKSPPEALWRHAALWYQGPSRLEARLKAASQLHAQAWQRLQARCGFRWALPGRSRQ